MESIEELEAELQRLGEFIHPKEGGGDTAAEDSVTNTSSKPKSLEELLNLLDNTSSGPVELDPLLLYSPARYSQQQDSSSSIPEQPQPESSYEHDDAYADYINSNRNYEYNDTHYNTNDTLFSTQQQQQQHQHHHLKTNNNRLAQRVALYKQQQEQKELQECTFQPKIGRPPLQGQRHHHLDLPVEERLLKHSGQRKEELARRILQERREIEASECTFAPKLISSYGSRTPLNGNTITSHTAPVHTKPPLYARLNEEWRKKEEIRKKVMEKIDKEATFKPQINPRSIQIVDTLKHTSSSNGKNDCNGDSESCNQHSNATIHGKIKIENRHATSTLKAHYEKQQPTFQPTINAASQQILNTNTSIPSDFHQRQRHFNLLKQESMNKLTADVQKNGPCTFQPHINTRITTAVLALSDTKFNHIYEDDHDRCMRMAIIESNEREARKTAIKAEIIENEATFMPKLNQRSLALAEIKGRPSLTDITSINKKLERDAKLKNEAKKKELEECTFFPDTSKRRVIGYYDEYQLPQPRAPILIAQAARSEGFGSLLKQIDEYTREKEAWAAEIRAQKEEKIMEECTFSPDTSQSKKVKMPKGPVVVAGLERFLEKKKNAERQAIELAKRAEKVFHLRPREPQRRGPTVPKPFNFFATRE